MNAQPSAGQSFPLGSTVYDDGVNFCVFSKNCYSVHLLLFDAVDEPQPAHVIQLDPQVNRTFYYWHIFLPGIRAGQLYAYRVDGPSEPERGHRFDGRKVLLDPYTKAIAIGKNYERGAALRPGDNAARAMKSVVVDPRAYDWEGDTSPNLSFAQSVIYEMHVGGFTKNPNSGVSARRRGTYAGLIEKIPYLQSLGITAVELLPVQQFDEQDATPPRQNYWGYSPVAFFAPHNGYASRKDPLGAVDEFRDMVKALHRAGIEVILDVVFNHTAEGSETGPTLSFRGLENRAYYILEPNQVHYANYSGCGNALNANQSIVRRLIMDCLRYWVSEMHVDGFRFDLASVLARDEWGQPLRSPPILWEIESDPVLAGTKIIAEAWDAVGLYQVGTFIGHRWAEWNGHFRDDVRRFVKGDTNTVAALAARIAGSPDIYPYPDREPNRSINFVTCHDGFTLNDWASYNDKHNEANGENNRDGNNANHSWNCGVEGPTSNPAIEALRAKQIKNCLSILLLSQGTPMLLMGDEVRHTQAGNNNAYCHDSELTWFDWKAVSQQADLLRFVQGIVGFTQWHPAFREERFWIQHDGSPRIRWHGVKLGQSDWGENSHSLAFSLHHPEGAVLHIMLNAYWDSLDFELPTGYRWRCIVDTAQQSPHDFNPPDEAPFVNGNNYRVTGRSSVILMESG